MGLKIMEYRARMLGGTINFEEPGTGTRIVLSAPLHLLRQSKDKMMKGWSGRGGCKDGWFLSSPGGGLSLDAVLRNPGLPP